MITIEKNLYTSTKELPYLVQYKEKTFVAGMFAEEASRIGMLEGVKDYHYIVDLKWVICIIEGERILMKTTVSANQYFLEDAIKYAWEASVHK